VSSFLELHIRRHLFGMVLSKKMEACLAGRKRLYLSKGSRLTLIKITLSHLPTNYLPLAHSCRRAK
jgi:hypothetical protein